MYPLRHYMIVPNIPNFMVLLTVRYQFVNLAILLMCYTNQSHRRLTVILFFDLQLSMGDQTHPPAVLQQSVDGTGCVGFVVFVLYLVHLLDPHFVQFQRVLDK